MRLIDADALKDELLSWARVITNPKLLGTDDSLYIIDSAPTVDAVQVVRCGECKHSYHTMNGKTKSSMRVVLACSEMDDLEVEPDWYCADGERKDDA